MSPRMEWIAGIVVVTGLVLSLGGLLGYATWDLLRQMRGQALSITASTWVAEFCARHPFAIFCAGYGVGALAAHFGWWQSPPRGLP